MLIIPFNDSHLKAEEAKYKHDQNLDKDIMSKTESKWSLKSASSIAYICSITFGMTLVFIYGILKNSHKK